MNKYSFMEKAAELADRSCGHTRPNPPVGAVVTMLAEKCAIMVELGFANSRMKDFFDVWTVLNEFDISEEVLKCAIAATFKRRGTKIDNETPLCFTEEFSSDERKSVQ